MKFKLFIKRNKIGILIITCLILWLWWDIFYNTKYVGQDVYNATIYYFFEGSIRFFQFLLPILVVMAGIQSFSEQFRSGYFKYIMNRKSYKKYMLHEVFHAWKSALIAPILILCSFIMCCFVSGFDLEFPHYDPSIARPGLSLSSTLVPNPIWNIVSIALNLAILSIACINLGLILYKREKNYYVTLFYSFLVIIAYQIVAEVIVGFQLSEWTGINFFANGVNFFCFWYYDAGTTPLTQFLYSSFLVFVTSIILYFRYRNKEGVIIASEK